MALTSTQLVQLLRMLRLTFSEEYTCDDCLRKLAHYAECNLLGKPISESLSLVRQHIKLCSECREEFEALCVALEGLDPSD